jgi:hypothetical protein
MAGIETREPDSNGLFEESSGSPSLIFGETWRTKLATYRRAENK